MAAGAPRPPHSHSYLPPYPQATWITKYILLPDNYTNTAGISAQVSPLLEEGFYNLSSGAQAQAGGHLQAGRGGRTACSCRCSGHHAAELGVCSQHPA